MAISNFRGINNYDESFLDKIKAWFSNTIYANTAITYNTIYNLLDGVENKMSFPLINIYRPNGFTPVPMQTLSARRQGEQKYTIGSETKAIGARYLTVDLMYQLDIYAKTLEKLNEITLDIMMAMNFFPTITLIHKDLVTKEEFKETYEITYLSGPHEQSEFDNNDRVYRNYIQYELKNAKVYDFTDYSIIKETEVKIDKEVDT